MSTAVPADGIFPNYKTGETAVVLFRRWHTDDFIHALSRIPRLNVIGHASVFVFKGVAQDARDFGAKLGAGTVVDGS